MVSSAVQDAVALLRSRYQEAVQQLSELDAEIATISDALDRLGYGVEASNPDVAAKPPVTRSHTKSKKRRTKPPAGPSVRSLVQEALEDTPTGLTNDDLVQRLERFRGARDQNGWRAVIRTAVWTLRESNLAETEDGRHFSTKWLKNADGPAVTGPSDPSDLDKEGGTDHAEAHSGDHPIQGWNNGHHRDPALLG
jgi:hypothetical protein